MSLELTRGESLVYTALLRLSSSKVAEIVKESHVSYSKVYDVLERLGLKALVSHKTISKIRYFQAVEPYRLYDYIERKEDYVKRQRTNNSATIKICKYTEYLVQGNLYYFKRQCIDDNRHTARQCRR